MQSADRSSAKCGHPNLCSSLQILILKDNYGDLPLPIAQELIESAVNKALLFWNFRFKLVHITNKLGKLANILRT